MLINLSSRTLTERMLAKAPTEGYSLWVDVEDPGHFYLAEAPQADLATATTFRGIRLAKTATGSPTGKIETREGFAWSLRTGAGWV